MFSYNISQISKHVFLKRSIVLAYQENNSYIQIDKINYKALMDWQFLYKDLKYQ